MKNARVRGVQQRIQSENIEIGIISESPNASARSLSTGKKLYTRSREAKEIASARSRIGGAVSAANF